MYERGIHMKHTIKFLCLTALVLSLTGCFWNRNNCRGGLLSKWNRDCCMSGNSMSMGAPMYAGAMGCSDCGGGVTGTMVSNPGFTGTMMNQPNLPAFGSSAGTTTGTATPERLGAPATNR